MPALLPLQLKHLSGDLGRAQPALLTNPSHRRVARALTALPSPPPFHKGFHMPRTGLKDYAHGRVIRSSSIPATASSFKKSRGIAVPYYSFGSAKQAGPTQPTPENHLEGTDFIVRRKHKHPSISRHWLAKMATRQRKESMLVKEKKRVRNRSKQEGLFLLSLLASCLSLYIRAQPTY